MSAVDLTEAVAAVEQFLIQVRPTTRVNAEATARRIVMDIAATMVEAQVRPQVREQIAAEIRTERARIKGDRIDAEITDQYDRGHLYGLSSAAHIARADS